MEAWSLTSFDCLRNARMAKTAVTIANTARTEVAAAVSWVAKTSDMGEGYAPHRRSGGYSAARGAAGQTSPGFPGSNEAFPR